MHAFQSIMASAPKRATPEPLRSTKAALAICAALLFLFPLCGLSDLSYNDWVVYSTDKALSASVYTYTSPSSTHSVNYNNIEDLDALSVIYKNVPFGLGVRASDGFITAPSATYSSNSVVNVNYQIKVSFYNASSNLVSRYFSPRSFSTLAPLYTFAALLFSSGYTGPAIDVVGVSGNYTYFNFDYRLAISDTLCSTNTVYRSLVLSHLSTVSGTLVNIGSSVGTINNDYRTVNDSYLNPSYSNISARAAYFNGLGGYGLDLENYLSSNPERAPEIAKAVLENARKNIGYVLNACRDPDSPFYGHSLQDVLDSPDDFERAISAGGGGSVVSQFANDVERARQAGENFNNSVNSRLDEIGASISGSPNSDAPSIMGLLGGGGSVSGGIAGDIKRLSTNDWASAVTNQLAENTDAIKEQLRNMFGSVTNDVHESSEVIKDELPGLNNYLSQIDSSSRYTSESVDGIRSHLENGVVKVDVVGADIGFTLDAPLTIENDQWTEISIPLSGIEGRLNRWYDDWTDFWDPYDEFRRWPSFYDMVGRIEAGLTNLVSTNEWDRYYFERFKRADTFRDNDDQSFKIDDACDLIFGNGFDIGEYDKLNWFSRVELLLYKFSSVTNTLETTDITSITNEVNTLNLNVTNFVNTSVKVVGVFKLIDGFAKSMRSAFSGYSSPQTSGVVLLDSGHWIGDEALVLKVPVEVQNALRLVFECIWYLSAFVIGWRILVWSWDKIVSMVRWLWSLIDI